MTMAHGSHDYAEDPRNEKILISLNGELLPRDEAKVSVFDGGFILGDGVWEALRLHRGKLVFLEDHLRRLFEGAKAIDLDIGMTPEALTAEILRALDANGMTDGVHIRLMVTRGRRATPYQDPRVTVGGPTIVIIPEHKTPAASTAETGVRLFTVHVGRGAPHVQDPKLNSHSKLNCILACIQATKAGADEALMLDPHGFVATCNSTHFFVVRRGEVWTSTGDWCLGGITRGKILQLCRENDIPAFERAFSVTEVHGADEAFVTGTFAGVVPVVEVDGRLIGDPMRVRPGMVPVESGADAGGSGPGEGASAGPRDAAGPITRRLRDLYLEMIERECGS
jgi:branched-chain amino acid aminotransferase